MENSPYGTVVGTLLCRDDDKEGPNGMIHVNSQWFIENQRKYLIPFEIITRPSNISEV